MDGRRLGNQPYLRSFANRRGDPVPHGGARCTRGAALSSWKRRTVERPELSGWSNGSCRKFVKHVDTVKVTNKLTKKRNNVKPGLFLNTRKVKKKVLFNQTVRIYGHNFRVDAFVPAINDRLWDKDNDSNRKQNCIVFAWSFSFPYFVISFDFPTSYYATGRQDRKPAETVQANCQGRRQATEVSITSHDNGVNDIRWPRWRC